MAIKTPIKAGTADKIDFRSLVFASSSTYHRSRFASYWGNPASERWPIPISEPHHSYDDEEEAEERAWNTFFAHPRVQTELERLAEETERQFAAGETEKGGFAIE